MTDIIQLMKAKDEKGLSLLYDSYAPALLGIIVRIVKNKPIGEEVLQSTLLKAWDSIELYDHNKGNFFTWLATIARRKALDKVRLKGYQRQMDNEELVDTSINLVSNQEETELIDTQRLLSSLNENHRVILDMIYLQGYTHKDTAQTLELPLGTVKTRLRIAIKLLRESLEGEKELFLGSFLLLIILIVLIWA